MSTRFDLGFWSVLVLSGQLTCGGRLPPPAYLALDEEPCERCRMAISERRFAAQSLAPGSEAIFFDDAGCLVLHSQEMGPPAGAAHYVVDYETEEWLMVDGAFFVKSARIPSPMGYGVAAFRSEEKAAAMALTSEGRVLNWLELRQELSRDE